MQINCICHIVWSSGVADPWECDQYPHPEINQERRWWMRYLSVHVGHQSAGGPVSQRTTSSLVPSFGVCSDFDAPGESRYKACSHIWTFFSECSRSLTSVCFKPTLVFTHKHLRALLHFAAKSRQTNRDMTHIPLIRVWFIQSTSGPSRAVRSQSTSRFCFVVKAKEGKRQRQVRNDSIDFIDTFRQ